jgi:ERCC4-type nuclease
MPRIEHNFNEPTVPTALDIPKIPEGFTVLQDTREQIPLFSPHRLSKGLLHMWKGKVPVVGATLTDGDYSILGMEDEVCIELKRWSDFLSYIGRERQLKTEPKLERMSKMRFAALVVQEDFDELWYPQMQGFGTKMQTNHVRGFLRSVNVKYGIHVYASKSEELCQMWVLDRLIGVYNQILEERENECT